jgi:hypothetical protein
LSIEPSPKDHTQKVTLGTVAAPVYMLYHGLSPVQMLLHFLHTSVNSRCGRTRTLNSVQNKTCFDLSAMAPCGQKGAPETFIRRGFCVTVVLYFFLTIEWFKIPRVIFSISRAMASRSSSRARHYHYMSTQSLLLGVSRARTTAKDGPNQGRLVINMYVRPNDRRVSA